MIRVCANPRKMGKKNLLPLPGSQCMITNYCVPREWEMCDRRSGSMACLYWPSHYFAQIGRGRERAVLPLPGSQRLGTNYCAFRESGRDAKGRVGVWRVLIGACATMSKVRGGGRIVTATPWKSARKNQLFCVLREWKRP